MSASMLLACAMGARCEVYRPQGVSDMPREFPVEEDLLLVVDSDDAVVQIARLSGDSRHATALASRHVRQQGLIEGDASVIGHATLRRGGEYDLLFTAYPTARWKALQAWASSQAHAVAVVPVLALLWNSLRPGAGVIYRSGARFTFLANVRGAPVHFHTQAFSEEVSDLVATAGILADGIRAQLSAVPEATAGAGIPLESLGWVCRLATAQSSLDIDPEVIARVEAQLQLKVDRLPHEPLRGASQGRMLGLAYLAQGFHPRLAVCAPSERAALVARQHLKLAGWAASGVAALAVLGAAGFWASSLSLRATAGRTADEAARIEALIRQRAAAEVMPTQFDETRALVERLGSFADSPDLTQILGALRAAGGSGVKVLRVYTVLPEKGATSRSAPAPAAAATGAARAGASGRRIQIDATVDAASERSESDALSDFVALLRKQGFALVEAEGQSRGNLASGRTVFSYELKTMRNESPEQGAR